MDWTLLFPPSHNVNSINKTRWRNQITQTYIKAIDTILVRMSFQMPFFYEAMMMMDFQDIFLNLWFLTSHHLDFSHWLNKPIKLNAVLNDLSKKNLKSYLNVQLMNSHWIDKVTFLFKSFLFLRNCTLHRGGKAAIISLGRLSLKDKTFSFDYLKHRIREVPSWILKWWNKKYCSIL